MLGHAWLLDDQKAAFSTAPFTADSISVSSYLSTWLLENNCESVQNKEDLYIEDPQITACLLRQALEFLQRSIGNTAAHYMLALNGLETWSRVTNYYASYFSVHGLLCLQGRTITRLNLNLRTPVLVQLVPIDLRKHVFGIIRHSIGKNPHHQAPWKRFYNIYDRYSVSHEAYERVVREVYTIEPDDESAERNFLNYTPFAGFIESDDSVRRRNFISLFGEYAATLERKSTLDEFLDDLQGFAMDSNHRYFARTLLKMALIGNIFLSLRASNSALRLEWPVTTLKWRQFLDDLFPDTNNCYLLKFVPLIVA